MRAPNRSSVLRCRTALRDIKPYPANNACLTCDVPARFFYAEIGAVRKGGCLYTHRPLPRARDEEAVANRQTSSLLAVVIVLALLVVGLFLVQRLHNTMTVEDCIMAGRTNCDALVAPHP